MELQLFDGGPVTKANIESMAVTLVGELASRDEEATAYVKAKGLEELAKRVQDLTKDDAIDYARERKELGGVGVAYVKPSAKRVYKFTEEDQALLNLRTEMQARHKQEADELAERIKQMEKRLEDEGSYTDEVTGSPTIRVTIPK
jgi:hypothetical protein